MDYFQGVVTEFLRADRAVFVNTECLIQLEPGNAPRRDRHWYCDAVAVNMQRQSVYLCEVSYSRTLHALLRRLQSWRANWTEIRPAVPVSISRSRVPRTSSNPWSPAPPIRCPANRARSSASWPSEDPRPPALAGSRGGRGFASGGEVREHMAKALLASTFRALMRIAL